MKSQLHFFLLICLATFSSCSTEDTLPNNDLNGQNGFQFADQVFATNNVYITDTNVVILTNNAIDAESVVNNINFARFETTDASLDAQSYTVGNNLASCFTVTGAQWQQGVINDGEIILQEQDVTSGFLRIKNIDHNIKIVKLLFEFERTDGQIVAGTYEGSFETLSL